MRLVVGIIAVFLACAPSPASQFASLPTGTAPPEVPAAPARNTSAWVTTAHNDQARTGQYLYEPTLTPATVDATHFGRLFSLPVDGVVYAQPLLALNVDLGAVGTHNLLFVATSHDSVYAFDADEEGPPLWQVSLLPPGATTVPSTDVGSADISPEIGITSTPVIDPLTNTLYVEAKSKEPGPVYVHRLHALALETGAERAGSPVVIDATVEGTASDGCTGCAPLVRFNALRQLQRSALLLSNGVVWLGFGSHGDVEPYHGWVLGYDATTLARTAAFITTPNGSEGSIWQSGGGIATDDTGALYLETANGDFDAAQGGQNLGDAVLKLNLDGVLLDWFAPHDQAALSQVDLDLGSGGPLVLPDQPGARPHLLIATGKNGMLYLLDRDDLGRFNANDDSHAVQTLLIGFERNKPRYGLYSTPTYFQGAVYVLPANGPLQAYPLTNGLLSPEPSMQTTDTFSAATISISANGGEGAIAWFIEGHGSNSFTPAVLHAFDANDLTHSLYSSDDEADRDQGGDAATFAVPTVANGHVYVGTRTQIDVFGLLP